MNVLIVDDSIVFRSAIRQAIDGVDGINVVSTAIHGGQALEKLQNFSVDAIVIDLEMPVLDGISTIKEIRKTDKNISIIVFSALSQAGASKTLEALSAGAQDFLAKNLSEDPDANGIDEIRSQLVPKIKQFEEASRLRNEALERQAPKKVASGHSMSVDKINSFKPDAICIGSSTGGPEALKNLFSKVTQSPNVPVFVTQHMPPMFTKQLANMLNQQTYALTVKEAEEGDIVQDNFAYIAPGDFHMCIVKNEGENRIQLTQTEKVNSVRPAVDVMMNSAAVLYPKMINFILTGMGEDGLTACRNQKELGNPVLIQSEESCVVFGMPGAISREGIQDLVGDIDYLSNFLSKKWR